MVALLAAIGGHVITAATHKLIVWHVKDEATTSCDKAGELNKKVKEKTDKGTGWRKRFWSQDDRLNFYVGGFERAITVLLAAAAPKQLPWFIGGWILLKMAAFWETQPEGRDHYDKQLALLGNVISFSVAIMIVFFFFPDNLISAFEVEE